MGKQLRNTKTDRLCPQCQGVASVTADGVNVVCAEEHCYGGWIRWAPIDPLDELKQRRQHARASWGGLSYGRLRQRAMSPVCLPRDLPSIPQLITNVELARDALRWAA